MHIVAAVAYGFTVWLAMLLYAGLAGEHFAAVFLCAPVIISGSMCVLWALEWAVSRLIPFAEDAAPGKPSK